MTQNEALTILKTGANVFLTGEPGSGKTHTVNEFTHWLRERGIEPAITASTGIAATHIGGYTIHSWSGIGIKKFLSPYDLDKITQNERASKRIRNAHTLIIDEVSMLSAGTLSMAEAVCRAVRSDERPFGGLQVVLVGDFFQLPPVTRRQDTEEMPAALFESGSGLRFAFDSDVWARMNPLVCYLSEQHRQEDPEFLELLLAMRRAAVTHAHKELLSSRRSEKWDPQSGASQLFSHNADVDRMNDVQLGRIDSSEHLFAMESRGNPNLVEGLKRGCLSPERLALKVGARVMFTKNNFDEGFVNGTMGSVVDFAPALEGGYPIVETLGGMRIEVGPADWQIEDNGRVLASITQIPLRLAWAMTIHKSQGLSLDAAHMDLSRTFEYGQGYVALSRVRTLQGLTLSGINERALEVHPNILDKDESFHASSDAAREAFGKIPTDELAKMHALFVKASGGKEPIGGSKAVGTGYPDRIQIPGTYSSRSKRSKVDTFEETLRLFREGKSLEEIAEERGIQARTILGHIEELVVNGKLPVTEVMHLMPESAAIEEIHAALRSVEGDKLRPIFEHLGERYTWDQIRLARLLFKK